VKYAVALIFSLLAGRSRLQDEAPILIRVGTLIDGTGGPAQRDRAILIERGVIRKIGDASMNVAGAKVIDLPDGTLLPGLIDCHVHLTYNPGGDFLPGERAIDLKIRLRSCLAAGVTTVRSLGDEPESVLPLREGVPRVFAAGAYFNSDNPDRIGPWMDRQVALRVDLIKVWSTGRSRRTLTEVIRQAHARGLRCVVHVDHREVALAALEDGADGIEHSPRLMDDEIFRKLKEKNVFWVPTLAVNWHYAVGSSEVEKYLSRAEVRRLVPRVIHLSAQSTTRVEARRPPDGSDRERKRLEAAMRYVAKGYREGVRIAAGSDAGMPNVFWGAALLLELELLVQAGLTPEQAVHCATGRAAEHLGREDIGTIRPGRLADLLLVRGDLSKGIRGIYSPHTVLSGGRIVAPKDFAAEYELPEQTDTPRFGSHTRIMTDQAWGGSSTAQVEGTGPWRFSGEVRPGKKHYVVLGLDVSERGFQAIDGKGHTGLRFRIRGKGPSLHLRLASLPLSDYDFPSAAVPFSEEEKVVSIPFSTLQAQDNRFDPSRIHLLQFVVSEPGTFEFWIRDFELYR